MADASSRTNAADLGETWQPTSTQDDSNDEQGGNRSEESADEVGVWNPPKYLKYKGVVIKLASDTYEQPKSRKALAAWMWKALTTAGDDGKLPNGPKAIIVEHQLSVSFVLCISI
jgi:hypothetical protein